MTVKKEIATNRSERRARPAPEPGRDEQAKIDAIKAAAAKIELLGAPELTLAEAVIFKGETGYEPLDYIAAQNSSTVKDFDGHVIEVEVSVEEANPDNDPDFDPSLPRMRRPMMAQPPTAVVRVLHMLWHRRHGKPEYTLAEADESMTMGDLLGEVAQDDPTNGD